MSTPVSTSTPTSTPTPAESKWTVAKIRELTQKKFGKRACWFQVKVAQALYSGKDVIGCAPTGAGKTLSFWIPLLMALEDGKDKMSIVVTPLNLLGKQNVKVLDEAGLPAIAISKENANKTTFKDVENGKYRVVVINPEILMGNEEMQNLWKKQHVTKRILNFIFDEGHCITQWGKFRKEYLQLGDLRYLIPERIPFYVASATLPTFILSEIIEVLKLRPKELARILYSNDRPDIRLMVRSLSSPAKSFKDLAFLIPNDFSESDPAPAPFLVFFDNTKECEKACKFLQARLPESLREKLKWFHSTMTQAFRDTQVDAMKAGEVWGMLCTDAFGMGMDLSHIEIVVQWKATCDLSTLWQRFGRGARGLGKTATAILLVERKDTDDGRQEKEQRALKRKEQIKEGGGRKRKTACDQDQQPSKRPALGDRAINVPNLDKTAQASTAIETTSFKEERRALYATHTIIDSGNKNAKRNKGKERGIEVAMDDYINASAKPPSTPQQHFSCRRAVPTIYFGNDKTPVDCHLMCDTSNPSGCLRCRPQPMTVCCDLCHPDAFKSFCVPAEKAAKVPSKSHIKPFSMEQRDCNLKKALQNWRQSAASERFHPNTLRALGVRILMSDQTLQRIVECAHFGKITTTEQLSKETGWIKERVDEYGESILSTIRLITPIQESNNTDGGSASAGRKRSTVKCSACHEVGHISSNQACPQRVEARRKAHENSVRNSTASVSDRENIPPRNETGGGDMVNRRPQVHPPYVYINPYPYGYVPVYLQPMPPLPPPPPPFQ